MEQALKAFQALSDPTRLAVFQCIRCDQETGCDSNGCQCGSESCCVPLGDVKGQVSCSPSTMTHHLNALRDAGLIATERRGRAQFVRVVPEGLENLVRFLQERPTSCSITPIQTETQNHVNE